VPKIGRRVRAEATGPSAESEVPHEDWRVISGLPNHARQKKKGSGNKKYTIGKRMTVLEGGGSSSAQRWLKSQESDSLSREKRRRRLRKKAAELVEGTRRLMRVYN